MLRRLFMAAEGKNLARGTIKALKAHYSPRTGNSVLCRQQDQR